MRRQAGCVCRSSAVVSSSVGGRTHLRDFSYGMNCAICHATDLSKFLAPTKTLLYMEASFGPNDYSGEVGPSFASSSLALRHGAKGHLVFADLRVEKLGKKPYSEIEKTKRFWLPTDDLSGPAGGWNLR